MLLFYALEARSAWFVLAFAGACLTSSVYGFLQGAWPYLLTLPVRSSADSFEWTIPAVMCG